MKYIFLLIALLIASCTSSHLYSPSFDLAHKSLKKDDYKAGAGMALFSESRPEFAGEYILDKPQKTDPGMYLFLGYGFTDNFSLHTKGWMDISGYQNWNRGGASVSSLYRLPSGGNTEIFLSGTYGMVMGGADIEGHGFAVSMHGKHNGGDFFRPYMSLSLIYGFHDISDKFVNEKGEEAYQHGYSIMPQPGISISLTRDISINAELALIYQYNNFDDVSHFIPAPSISITYSLKNK
ncbi:MAG: hypothetical protein ACLFR2_06215 [Candidatus Kapaibacterium sp.]